MRRSEAPRRETIARRARCGAHRAGVGTRSSSKVSRSSSSLTPNPSFHMSVTRSAVRFTSHCDSSFDSSALDQAPVLMRTPRDSTDPGRPRSAEVAALGGSTSRLRPGGRLHWREVQEADDDRAQDLIAAHALGRRPGDTPSSCDRWRTGRGPTKGRIDRGHRRRSRD